MQADRTLLSFKDLLETTQSLLLGFHNWCLLLLLSISRPLCLSSSSFFHASSVSPALSGCSSFTGGHFESESQWEVKLPASLTTDSAVYTHTHTHTCVDTHKHTHKGLYGFMSIRCAICLKVQRVTNKVSALCLQLLWLSHFCLFYLLCRAESDHLEGIKLI